MPSRHFFHVQLGFRKHKVQHHPARVLDMEKKPWLYVCHAVEGSFTTTHTWVNPDALRTVRLIGSPFGSLTDAFVTNWPLAQAPSIGGPELFVVTEWRKYKMSRITDFLVSARGPRLSQHTPDELHKKKLRRLANAQKQVAH